MVLETDQENWRPHVTFVGLKSSNDVTILCSNPFPERWKLFNHVLPHIQADLGKNISSKIREGRRGKEVTPKMRNPGARERRVKMTEAKRIQRSS